MYIYLKSLLFIIILDYFESFIFIVLLFIFDYFKSILNIYKWFLLVDVIGKLKKIKTFTF